MIELACGHNFHLASLPPLRYSVGEHYDCMRCTSDAWEREHPGLSDEQIAAIEASLPKCPECGSAIDKIPFIKRTVHKFDVQIDRQNGDILASSEDHDTLEEEPDWTKQSVSEAGANGATYYGEIDVECADGHHWIEKRLAYKYDWRGHEHNWRVLPAESAS